MTTKKQVKSRLDSWILVPAILDNNLDCTLSNAWVYSYMLCKYQWFKSKNQEYFESQSEISDSARVSLGSVKLAIKYLKDKGLIEVAKKKGSMHFNNQYVVKDLYGVYSKPNNTRGGVGSTKAIPNPKQIQIKELEDLNDPF